MCLHYYRGSVSRSDLMSLSDGAPRTKFRRSSALMKSDKVGSIGVTLN